MLVQIFFIICAVKHVEKKTKMSEDLLHMYRTDQWRHKDDTKERYGGDGRDDIYSTVRLVLVVVCTVVFQYTM